MINFVQGSIFDVPRGTYIAHGISGDFSLGAGIAKQIDETYNMRYKLFLKYPFDNGKNTGYLGEALLVDDVFNLVNKPHYKTKVDMDAFVNAFADMRSQCQDMGVDKIAMPKIGTGHDHLNWDKVLEIIEAVFDEDCGIDIDIYSL